MSDENSEQDSQQSFKPNNPFPDIDSRNAPYYLLNREIWRILIEQDEETFTRQFAIDFNTHFDGVDEQDLPQYRILFSPTLSDAPLLIAQVLMRGITNTNRELTRTFFAMQQERYRVASGDYDSLCRSTQGYEWGGGGPGGIAFPQLGPIQNKGLNSDQPTLYDFVLPTIQPNGNADRMLSAIQATYGGQNVQVAILDTAPQMIHWNNAVTEFANHPLVQSLNNVIEIRSEKQIPLLTEIDENDITNQMALYGLKSYPMVDHGLFVAGIIHSIAPKASIKLYRVLDDNGVGLRFVVTDGLREASRGADRDMTKPLIINCSLNLILTNDEDFRETLGETEENWGAMAHSDTIVGAAGNEGLDRTRPPHGETPPYPRYPAGFTKTLGVTALNQTGDRTAYANWAEDYDLADSPVDYTNPLAGPDRVGIATMGGSIALLGNLRIANPSDSILGLYITDNGLPGLAHMVQGIHPGWARWSGTSFANAIVSGVLALIASYRHANSLPTDQDALVADLLEYCENRLSENGQDYEYILKVSQGT